jgi:hypothetical protein
LQTTFVLRVFEIRGADISARSLKVQKIKEKQLFSRFSETKKKSFFIFTTRIRTKINQVGAHNIIQMIFQNLVEVSNV